MAKKQSLGLVSVVVLAMFTAMAGCHKNDGTQEVDAAAANGNLAPVGDTGAAPMNESVAPAPAIAPAYSTPARQAPSYPAQTPQQYPQQAQQPQYPAPDPQYAQQYQDQPQDQDQQYQSQEYGDQPYQAAEYAPQPP